MEVNVLITSAHQSMLGHSQKVDTQISTSTAQSPKNHALETRALVLGGETVEQRQISADV